MKNTLAVYIEALADIAAKKGELPKNAASDKLLKLVWQGLRRDMAAALEARQLAAVAAEIIASSPKARAALLSLSAADRNCRLPLPTAFLDDFGPIKDALDKISAKTVVPSSMRSAEWAAVPVQIREASQFSAGIESARVMSAIQRRLTDNLAPQSLYSSVGWDFKQPKGREAFIRDMRGVMETEGVGWETKGEGSLANPRANSRLGLIYDQQTRSARGYAARKISMDPDMLAEVPAQELVREAAAKVPRDWTQRFKAAGGTPRAGRLAALKTDPVWTDLSRFGTPWPPFDFGSHMGVRDLFRAEAVELGLMSDAAELTPEPVPSYLATATASVAGLPDAMLAWLASAFGPRLSVADGTATLLPSPN